MSAACDGDSVLGHRRRRDVERRELRDEALDRLGLGALVDAVERRDLALVEQRRDALVGGDHQVLDEAVRLGLLARRPGSRRGRAGRRRTRARSRSIASAPRASRRAWSAAAAARAAASGSAHGASARSSPGEDPVDAVVVEARVGADQRAVERAAHDLRAAQLHLDRDREAVDVRAQRAGVVRQRLGSIGSTAPGT